MAGINLFPNSIALVLATCHVFALEGATLMKISRYCCPPHSISIRNAAIPSENIIKTDCVGKSIHRRTGD